VNADALQKIIGGGTIFEIFNMFSGGALDQFSVFALGIMPYISASIILQLLTVVGFGISIGLEQQGVLLPGAGGPSFYLTAVTTLTAGTCFLMWLGEQISERGIGNGISLIIFSGIVARVPSGFRDAWTTKDQFGGLFGFLLLLGFIVVIIGIIIFFERSHRRIPIQYAKRVVGRKLYGGTSTHLPLKINMAGVIPPIFASSLMLFPATIAQFVQTERLQNLAGLLSFGWLHLGLYVVLIVFFTFFSTAVTFTWDSSRTGNG
jgi:preprotein translocase subunit SecY